MLGRMRALPEALSKIAADQDGLFTRRQAKDAGLATTTLDSALGHGLARVLPTVYAAFTGELSLSQRLRAAVLYGRVGGEDTVGILGGMAACHVHGLRAASDFDVVQLLMPRPRELAHSGFVVVRRANTPGKTWRVSGLPVCSPARAIVDASRRFTTLDEARALVAEGVQRRKTTVQEIADELESGGSSGSLLPRRVLAEVDDGVRSVAEAHLHELLERRGFPSAIWNGDLFDIDGVWLARPDAIWPEAGLIVEVESREWHLSPDDWAATMRRTNVLNRLGYTVQQFPPSQISADPDAVLDDLRAAYVAGKVRVNGLPSPDVVIRPTDKS